MAAKVKSGASKGANKRSTKPASSGPTSKAKNSSSVRTPASKHSQARSKPVAAAVKKAKKPPHLRYNVKELGVPQLNGIRPLGVQKLPNKKKGKNFVDDGEGMRTILAMVMAEKEGNIESKMMRARQMEEIREAKRVEAEKRVEGKKGDLEEKKNEIKAGKRKKGKNDSFVGRNGDESGAQQPKRSKKKVSFG